MMQDMTGTDGEAHQSRHAICVHLRTSIKYRFHSRSESMAERMLCAIGPRSHLVRTQVFQAFRTPEKWEAEK